MAEKELWADFVDDYKGARRLFPWSDVAHFLVYDESFDEQDEAFSTVLWAYARTADYASASKAVLSGSALVIATGSDGVWMVIARLHESKPARLLTGASILCPLEVPSGRLHVHCGSQFDVDFDDSRSDITREDHLWEVPPGRYVARVLATDFPDEDYEERSLKKRAPAYLIDLWPRQGRPKFRWRTLA